MKKNQRKHDFLAKPWKFPKFIPISDEIKFRMKLLNYPLVKEKPDLLIIYKIFLDDFWIRGHQQPEMKQWMIKEDST